MWKPKPFTLPSVLIVENKDGNVFIVENKSEKSLVEKILKNNKKAKIIPSKDNIKIRTSRKSLPSYKEIEKNKLQEFSPLPIK